MVKAVESGDDDDDVQMPGVGSASSAPVPGDIAVPVVETGGFGKGFKFCRREQ